MMASVFELRNIMAGYGKRPVLTGIDLTIEKGDFIGIIGPNGAGKSTLIKVLGGYIQPSRGECRFKGKPYGRYTPRGLAREFSVVHQSHENILPFSVHDFVAMGRFPHQGILPVESARDREIIERAIETTGIAPLIDRKITELSGGELQLVFIAHSLAHNSDTILLDEPISHLDMKHSVQIMDILHSLNEGGATIVTVLHDINSSSDYCRRIIGIKEGGLFIDDEPEKALTYETLEELFETICLVKANPVTGKPAVFPVPRYARKVL